MPPLKFTRRIAVLGAVSALGGCSAVSALNSAAQPLDTYDLTPSGGARTGRRTSRTVVIARPEAPAAIATDRIMIKPDAVSITYLPDARWADEAPLVLQSILVRSISESGRLGYVGRSEGGPVADTAVLVRMDDFHVVVTPEGRFTALVTIALTALNDRDQRVIGTRSFTQSAQAASDTPTAVVAAFQAALHMLLPSMADWVIERA